MKLINFLNDLFKEDGFILIDYNSNRYVNPHNYPGNWVAQEYLPKS